MPRAFTLLEVMIASSIFFIAIFAILNISTQQLRSARILQSLEIDSGILPSLISLTNKLHEGPLPPGIQEAFYQMANDPDRPGAGGGSQFSCEGTVARYATNGLFQVDYTIYKTLATGRVMEYRNTLLLWRPLSP